MNASLDPAGAAQEHEAKINALHGRGDNLILLAVLALVAAIILFVVGLVLRLAPDADARAGFWQLILSGGLTSAAVLFYFFGQLLHIRAAVEKTAEKN